MPVAITPIDGYARATLAQLGIEKRNQLAHLPVDGTDAAKMLIMFGNFEHALMRDISSTQHIFKERNNVGGLFGSAECNQKERVVCGHSAALANTWHLLLCWRRTLALGKTRNAAPAFGPDHLLCMIFRVLWLGGARRQRNATDDLFDFGAIEHFALE